jgi:FkbM family methyltransferase
MESLYHSDIFIQIGTNDGNDNFNKLVALYKPKHVILVEPNYELYQKIVNNYHAISQHTRVTIINKCIYQNDDETVSLFIPAKDGIYGNPGVQPERVQGNLVYSNKHFSLLPMNDWGEKKHMIELKSKSVSFSTLCKSFDISSIDYLQIDTEGYDSEIINMIDFSSITIKVIRYEIWPFDENCFSKYHNDNKNLYGINGMKNVENLLKRHNYQIEQITDEDGNDMIAYHTL